MIYNIKRWRCAIVGFLEKLVFGTITVAEEIHHVNKIANEAAEILKGLLSDDGISPQAFLYMYNLKQYDFNNKQRDIKFMKSHDFSGIYIIYNPKSKQYFVGKGKTVLKKIDRQFRGYGNPYVYAAYQKNIKLSVRAIRLIDTDYDNLDILARDMCKELDAPLI